MASFVQYANHCPWLLSDSDRKRKVNSCITTIVSEVTFKVVLPINLEPFHQMNAPPFPDVWHVPLKEMIEY